MTTTHNPDGSYSETNMTTLTICQRCRDRHIPGQSIKVFRDTLYSVAETIEDDGDISCDFCTVFDDRLTYYRVTRVRVLA